MPDPISWYSRLVRCYPPEVRERYGAEMITVFADQRRESGSARPSPRDVSGELWHLTRAHVVAIRRSTTSGLRRTAAGSILLLLPFAVAIAVPGRDGWAWSRSAVDVWLLALPAAAVALCVVAWSANLVRARTSWRTVACSVAVVAVPVLVASGALGLGVFHDSVGCVTRQPLDVVGCVERTAFVG